MSAFIVENQTINKVVSHLRYNRDDYHRTLDTLREIGHDIEADDFAENLGRAMAQLNDLAIAERYGASEVENMRGTPYAFRPENAYAIHVSKALQCWLYQAMEEMDNTLCRNIVGNLPEYEAAAWS